MRSFIVMAMFVASLASATWKEHTEARHLQLPAEGITVFELDTGAGSLTIKGMPDARNIRVKAIIRVPKESEERAQKVIASDLKLTLDRSRDHAKLRAKFDSKSWGSDSGGSIDLEVEMPTGLALDVNDGAGQIDISDVEADVKIDDGSGSIVVRNVGNIRIDDGSGSIKVIAAGGDVSIDDGSGGIAVEQVGGSVLIDDGSGAIDVSDVEHDLIIVNEGSGGITVSNVRGSVEKNKS